MIKIYSTPHVYFDSLLLKDKLTRLGFTCMNVDGIEPGDDSIYIIYPMPESLRLPERYVLYQTEAHTSRWFTPAYLRAISGAMAVWDYSKANTYKYQHLNSNISIVPPGVREYTSPDNKAGIMFYGAMNDKRKRIVNSVCAGLPHKVITNTFHFALWNELESAKVVLNIHYYENAPLEVFRINEALSHGCKVVSQPGAGMERYKGIVRFGDSVEELAALVKEALEDNSIDDISHLDNEGQILKALEYRPAIA